jgi:hypothetical protein
MPNSALRGVARDSAGNAVGLPIVTVYETGTLTLKTIFDAAGGVKDNPFTGAATGKWEFYGPVGDVVDYIVSKAGFPDPDSVAGVRFPFTGSHPDLDDLGVGDPHLQYLALAGRGGQTVADAVAFTSATTKSNPVFNVMHPDFGAVGDNSTNDSAAINAAIQAAKAAGGGVVLFPIPPVKYRCDTDILVNGNNITLRGMGWQSWLNMVGCGVVFDGTSQQLSGVNIEDLQIRRSGTAGIALDFVGGGSNLGPTRFAIRRVNIQGGQGSAGARIGTCIRLAGVNLGLLEQVFLHDCQYGIKTELNPGTAVFAAPQVMMVGGDITDCDYGIYGVNFRGWQMLGTTIQFCDTIGMDIDGDSRAVSISGVRFESNANFDLRVGNSGVGTSGLAINGCYFSNNLSHAITLIRAKGCAITGNQFNSSFTNEAIDIQEASAGAVTGYSAGNVAPNGVVAINGSRGWGQTTDLFVGSGNPAAGATRFGSTIVGDVASENSCTVPAPFTGYARNLYAEKSGAAGTGESMTVTMRVNNANTSLTAAISGASASSAQDLVNVASFVKGQRLAISFVATNNGSYSANLGRAAVELVRLAE